MKWCKRFPSIEQLFHISTRLVLGSQFHVSCFNLFIWMLPKESQGHLNLNRIKPHSSFFGVSCTTHEGLQYHSLASIKCLRACYLCFCRSEAPGFEVEETKISKSFCKYVQHALWATSDSRGSFTLPGDSWQACIPSNKSKDIMMREQTK